MSLAPDSVSSKTLLYRHGYQWNNISNFSVPASAIWEDPEGEMSSIYSGHRMQE